MQQKRFGSVDIDSAIPEVEIARRFLQMGEVNVEAELAAELENPITKTLMERKSAEEVAEVTRQLQIELRRSRWIDSVWEAVEKAKASAEVLNEEQFDRNNECKMVDNRLKETDDVSLNNGKTSLQYHVKGGEKEMALIVREPERRLCPAGLHGAKVEKIEPKHHEQWGERILFTFSINGKTYDDGMPIKVFSVCSNTLSSKAKLRRIVEDILGRGLTREEAQGFDLETLVGKVCRVVVKHEKGSDGNTWARVETVTPA